MRRKNNMEKLYDNMSMEQLVELLKQKDAELNEIKKQQEEELNETKLFKIKLTIIFL